MILATHQTFRDPVLLRQYIVSRFGQTLTHGGEPSRMQRGMRLCRLLARLSGRSLDQVLSDIWADARVLGEES
jgi:hypothetical protein